MESYDRQTSVMQEAQVLMSYWHNDDMFVVSDVYTQAEKEHLYDVKKLLVGLRYILLVVGFWLLVSGLWLYFR